MLRKREQLIYFLYSTDVAKLIDAVRVISNALDREDSSAQDINSWAIANPVLNSQGNTIPYNISFIILGYIRQTKAETLQN
jgi:hypothetical protein